MSDKQQFDQIGRSMLERALASSEQRFGSFFLSRLLGFEVSHGEDVCIVRFSADPSVSNPQGTLHGGVTATAMDISMGHFLERRVGPGATLEMNIKYLDSIGGGVVRAEGRALKMGRSIAFLESKVFRADETLCAIATATWKVLRSKKD